MAKYLDSNGLLYLWQKITNKFVHKEAGKGLSTNDFTTEEKNKLNGIDAGAQVNVKPDWTAGPGSSAEILNKPLIPSKTSDLTNDSNFITLEQVPERAAASNTSPKMDGVAFVGSEMTFARGDHVHPSDNTKADRNHNHDETYLKLSGGAMTGPIVFSDDQGQIKVDNQTAEAKVEIDSGSAEILFKNKSTNKINRMSVSSSGAEIIVGETSIGNGTGIKLSIDETNGVKIPMVADPILEKDAANKKYVDQRLSQKSDSTHDHNSTYYTKDQVYTKSEVDGKGYLIASDISNKADKSTSLSGYGITDAYTKTEIDGKGYLTASNITNKADKATSLQGYGITDAYTKTEIDSRISSVYKPAGNCLFANLPTPSSTNLGNVYSMMDSFTTDERFVASEPVQYPIGTNIVVIQVEGNYYFDVLSGFIDLSGYLEITDVAVITNQEIDEIVV